MSEDASSKTDAAIAPPRNPYYRPSYRTHLDEGPVLLEIPDNLSEVSVSDFEKWMADIFNRLKRVAASNGLQNKEPSFNATPSSPAPESTSQQT